LNKINQVHKKAKKAKTKAREIKVDSRFEVVGGDEAWKEIRKSAEQKITCPKVRISSNSASVVLFPENLETFYALRRTGKLQERKPALPRLIAKGVNSMLKLMSWLGASETRPRTYALPKTTYRA